MDDEKPIPTVSFEISTSTSSLFALKFHMEVETSIPTMGDIAGQKDETDKCMWYSDLTKECNLIYKEWEV